MDDKVVNPASSMVISLFTVSFHKSVYKSCNPALFN
jgi:hypothetical protein